MARRPSFATPRGATRARAVIACAGAWSDRLARAAGAPADPRIVPFRGGYLRLRPERDELVRASIYPVPDPELPFLGAHLTRGPDGSVLLGPTALMVGARDAYRPWRLRCGRPARDPRLARNAPTRRAPLARRRRASSCTRRRSAPTCALRGGSCPSCGPPTSFAGPAGIRAQAVAADGTLVDDFVVSRVGAAVFVRNAPSPAATSSLPLARLIADEARDLLG